MQLHATGGSSLIRIRIHGGGARPIGALPVNSQSTVDYLT